MKLKIAALAGALALAAAIPGVAEAASWWGYTTTSVNFRTSPGGSIISTIPAQARVHVIKQTGSWDQVAFGGQLGYVSASYISSQYVQVQPRVIIRGPAPTHGYFKKPWWDAQRQAWYDGRRWYRNGIWYTSPNFSIGFGFGG